MLKAFLFLLTLSSLCRTSEACTEIFIDRGAEKIAARNFDWPDDEGAVVISPRGVLRKAFDIKGSDRPAEWVSRYGSVGFHLFENGVVPGPVDGMNEAGLTAAALWLDVSGYETKGHGPSLNVGELVQYCLDNFGTVAEAVAHIPKIKVTAEAFSGMPLTLHFFLHDPSGDSAVLEYLDGELAVYRGSSLPVEALANDPYNESIEALPRYKDFGGTLPLPGGYVSEPRFVRAAAFLKRLPAARGAPEAVAYGFDGMEDVAEAPGTRFPTQWTVVRDLTAKKIFFRTIRDPAIKTLDLSKLDFSAGQPLKMVNIHLDRSGDIREEFRPFTMTVVSNAAQTDEMIVQIDSGAIRGRMRNGVRFYAGIPYAAPPVGDLRWKPPQPVRRWSGVRECVTFGPICPQPPCPGQKVDEVKTAREDCLYLNIWAPPEESDEKRPVMVWIHGGAFVIGAGSSADYDGTNFARQGVVLVSFNYRLGPFGFLVHPSLSEESPRGVSGNYGLLDQIEALRWVQRNIASFGGDPGNVTIFGESAGSMSVGLHTLMAQSGGLFDRAIMESGTPMADPHVLPLANGSMDQALKTGMRFAKALGCPDDSDVLASLRKKTTEDILAATTFSLDFVFAEKGMMFAPVYDGWLLPEDPVATLSRREQHNVPVIVGTNKDEATPFIQGLTVNKYNDWIARTFGAFADRVRLVYGAKNKEDLARKADKLCTLLWFQQPARYYARSMSGLNKNTYLYQFTRISPENREEKKLKAFHSCEIPYVFGHIEKNQGYEEYDRSLSAAIMKYWINFASTGDPNSPGLPEWPAYDAESNMNLDFGDSITVMRNLDKKSADLIEEFRLSGD
ncbi:carboxylesterase family protein [Candidatus Omnitrophota bacterium]